MGDTGIHPSSCRFLNVYTVGGLNVFKMSFGSIGEVQLFLRENPDVNSKVFFEMKSKTAEKEFAGPPLEDAIQYCIQGYSEGFEQFLELSKKMDAVNKTFATSRKTVKSFVGQRPCVPAFIAGAPKTMYRTDRMEEKKCIDIFMNITFPASTTVKQIEHRGIIALNLIKVLEQNGYIVDFHLFDASIMRNESFICEVLLKKPGEKLDVRKCYYPLCGKGFVRRIMARIKESMPFTANWGMGYGRVIKAEDIKKIMNIADNQIYIGSPEDMGIKGENIFKDADEFFKRLDLGDKITIPKYDDEKEKAGKEEELRKLQQKQNIQNMIKKDEARMNKWNN